MGQIYFMDDHPNSCLGYRFALQASSPKCLCACDPDDVSLSDAMQTVFPVETEYAIMIWNWTCIHMTYKYDISLMIDDVIDMADKMLSRPTGVHVIDWPSNGFAAKWGMEWGGGEVVIDAEWRSVAGNVESVLNARPRVVVLVSDFISEWKRPLEVIFGCLKMSGYSVDNLPQMRHLDQLMGRFSNVGILYR